MLLRPLAGLLAKPAVAWQDPDFFMPWAVRAETAAKGRQESGRLLTGRRFASMTGLTRTTVVAVTIGPDQDVIAGIILGQAIARS